MPHDWTTWRWRVLAEAARRDDQVPWTTTSSLAGQIKVQIQRR
ncbi:hypothetical protein [Streptomyces hydrogenans]